MYFVRAITLIFMRFVLIVFLHGSGWQDEGGMGKGAQQEAIKVGMSGGSGGCGSGWWCVNRPTR